MSLGHEVRVIVLVVASGAVLCAAYGWIEAGWLRTRVLEVPLRGLPEALDGVRIGRLSDFHLGALFSLGNRASEQTARWVAERRAPIWCASPVISSHTREARLDSEGSSRSSTARSWCSAIVNIAFTRDPFSRAAELHDLERARLLADEVEILTVREKRFAVVGVSPATYRVGRARPHNSSNPKQ